MFFILFLMDFSLNRTRKQSPFPPQTVGGREEMLKKKKSEFVVGCKFS